MFQNIIHSETTEEAQTSCYIQRIQNGGGLRKWVKANLTPPHPHEKDLGFGRER